MKNKESKNGLSQTKARPQSTKPNKPTKAQPTKTQIERLKKFYNTTRWLPNSAFTTYFGKPAFENYGYGNTNPVYGGLFYGNYMLSHNINPIDGENHPDEKQVYSSAMLKTIKRNTARKPEPPRNIPDEIRNTPEELNEINQRKPIFQYKNCFPQRNIATPDLLKARYFRSAKNSPDASFEENEDFDIDTILDPTRKKAKKVKFSKNVDDQINPFANEKVSLKKKKNKPELDNVAKTVRTDKSERSLKDTDSQYLTQKEYFEKMLSQDLEDQIEAKEEVKNEVFNEAKIDIEEVKNDQSFSSKLKKKENPCLEDSMSMQ
jgi:hypothetical protein